jgi:hypothetical protein
MRWIKARSWCRLGVGLVAIACLTAASTACGDDKPAVCGKRDDLRKSVDNLLKVNPVSGLGEVRTRLTDVRDSTTDLAKAAKDQYQPQVSALEASIATLTRHVQSLATSPSASALAAIPSEVSNVQRDASALLDAVGSACD